MRVHEYVHGEIWGGQFRIMELRAVYSYRKVVIPAAARDHMLNFSRDFVGVIYRFHDTKVSARIPYASLFFDFHKCL